MRLSDEARLRNAVVRISIAWSGLAQDHSNEAMTKMTMTMTMQTYASNEAPAIGYADREIRARRMPRFETIEHDEGVVATRSSTGLQVRLPKPESADHELRMIAVLWDLWIAGRIDGCDEEVRWTVRLLDYDELTVPLIAILSAIDAELGRTGHTLLVIGRPAKPATAIAQT